MLLGGVPGWAAITIAVLSLISAAVPAFVLVRRKQGVSLPAVVLWGIAMTSIVLAQSVPLPRAWVATYHPDLVRSVDVLSAALGQASPSTLAASWDPGATRAALVHAGGALAAATAAAIALPIIGRRALVACAAVSGALVALVALAHGALGATAVFGLYDPRWAAPVLLSPLLNGNNLAGLVGMCAPPLIALAVDTSNPRVRLAWLGSALVCVVVAVITLSRGGIVATLAGLLIFAVLAAFRRGDGRARRTSLGATAGATVVGAAIGLYWAGDAARSYLLEDDYTKLGVALRATDLVAAHPWLGVGRGGFSAAFVSLMGLETRYQYAECLPVQLAAEVGVPLALASFIVLGRAWLGSVVQARSWPRLGACAAVASIALHDLADFALELPGIAVVASTLLVAATAPSEAASTTPASEGRPPPLRVGLVAAGLAVGAVLVVWGGPLTGARSVSDVTSRAITSAQTGDWESFDREVRLGLADHPMEPAFALLAAHSHVRRGTTEAARWLNRAMILAPQWPEPRILAARWLVQRGALAQGLLELRAAEELRPGVAADLTCELIRAGQVGASEILVLARGNTERHALLDRAARCVPIDNPVAIAIDGELGDAVLVEPQLRRARRALAAGRHAEARAALERVPINRRDDRVTDLLAATLVEVGEPDAAQALVEGELRRVGTSLTLLSRLVRVQSARGDLEAARATVTRLRGRAAGQPSRIADAFTLLADVEVEHGNHGRAVAALEDARRVHPAPSSLVRLATLTERMGDLRRSYGAWDELCRTREEPSDCVAAERVRARMSEPNRGLAQPSLTP